MAPRKILIVDTGPIGMTVPHLGIKRERGDGKKLPTPRLPPQL
jgi:hypothetical protein